ncbi:hypothetical protein FOCC_FOCC007625 [Frankliniella occidentalis]|nr:hypothetical protein FOCC_FOCC007625 [Frankliniella occidentalis]
MPLPAGAPLLLTLLLLALAAQSDQADPPPVILFPESDVYTDLVAPPLASDNAGRRREDTPPLGDGEETVAAHVYAPCCAQAADADPACLRACLAALDPQDGGGVTLGRLLDGLQAGGCPLVPHGPLFLCLVSRSSGAVPTASSDAAVRMSAGGAGAATVLDAARLHCCALARAPACRRACDTAYREDWSAAGSGGALQQCLARANETALASCLAEVDAECRPGSHCSGLDFCAGLLGPPSWFRSCSGQADAAARATAARWARTGRLDALQEVPLLTGTAACGARLWRALSCVLHAQPCSPRRGTLPLCLQDCLRLLPACIHWSAVPAGFSAEQLCLTMSAPPPCVRIPEDGDVAGADGHSAEKQPAPAVDRAGPGHADLQGSPSAASCRLGAASDVEVPAGTAVRVPARSSPACYDACLCQDGVLGNCAPLPCAPHASRCSLGAGTIEHRRTVVMDCLVCTCSSGDTLCTQRQCAAPAAPAAPAWPCRCPRHHVPVCGDNGRTYDNACLARCAGLVDAQVQPGPCPLRDPCASGSLGNASSPCPRGQLCLPDRTECLSTLVQPCPQFQGSVCGADGSTYPSAGAALAARAPVDYPGACVPRSAASSSCPPSARCPPLPAGCVRGVRVACCETCASVLRASLNVKAVDRAVLGLQRLRAPWPRLHAVFSLQALLGQLQQQVLEPCTVLGYLMGPDQLLLLLHPDDSSDAVLRCYEEAGRLAGLFEQSAARVQVSLLLAALHGVDLGPAPVPAAPAAPDAAPGRTAPSPALLPLIVVLGLMAGGQTFSLF